MEILQQIRHLVNKREALLREADDIDRQLQQVQSLLGGGEIRGIKTDPPVRRVARVALGGLSQSRIVAALGEMEPQSVRQLRERLPEMTTLGQHLAAMAKAGTLARRRRWDGGNVYWYARSADVFGHEFYEGADDEVDTVASGPFEGMRAEDSTTAVEDLSGDAPNTTGASACSRT